MQLLLSQLGKREGERKDCCGLTNFICQLNINHLYYTQYFLQSGEVKKKKGPPASSMKAATDDENINVHLVFFFSPVCEGRSERASRRRSADNVCRPYRWRSLWMQNKWASEKQQAYYYGASVHAGRVRTTVGSYFCGDVNSVHWKLITAAKTCLMADGEDDKHNPQDMM